MVINHLLNGMILQVVRKTMNKNANDQLTLGRPAIRVCPGRWTKDWPRFDLAHHTVTVANEGLEGLAFGICS